MDLISRRDALAAIAAESDNPSTLPQLQQALQSAIGARDVAAAADLVRVHVALTTSSIYNRIFTLKPAPDRDHDVWKEQMLELNDC